MTVTLQAQLEEHNRRLEEVCPMGNIRLWRAIKGLLYALIISGNVAMGLYFGGRVVPVIGIVSIIMVFGIEFEEVQVASWFTATFRTGVGRERERDDDGEE